MDLFKESSPKRRLLSCEIRFGDVLWNGIYMSTLQIFYNFKCQKQKNAISKRDLNCLIEMQICKIENKK